jgi:REP element-mobilizing transposase RayT
MARARKHPEQLTLRKVVPEKRKKGAGRPKKGKFASERHKTRPELTGREPGLCTVRVRRGSASLRRGAIYQAIRRALRKAINRADFRVIHFSIQSNHLHLVAEADHKMALARGMQGLLISAARHINRAWRRSGTVFPDRYHERILKTPRQCRNAIRYVLNNFRRHREDFAGEPSRWKIDRFSSAISFTGWKELGLGQTWAVPPDYEPLPIAAPTTWLLTLGWTRHGLIGVFEVPGSKAEL